MLVVRLSTLSMPLVPLESVQPHLKRFWPFEDEKLLKEMLTSITEKFHAAEETQKSFQKSH
jgi:hypothetical protein